MIGGFNGQERINRTLYMWVYLTCSTDLTSSPALADLASHSSHGSEPSPTVSETDTLKLCCCRELLLANSTELLSGTTLHRSEGPCFQVSTSSLADSHVRTSALQEMVQAWQESEAVFIRTSKDLSEKQIQLSSFLKTYLRSGLADLLVWCGDWPRLGMISDGQLFLPQALERHTRETDGSALLPTPSASSYGTNRGGAAGRNGKERPSLETMARRNLWPTPKASDADKGIRTPEGAAKEFERSGRRFSDLHTAVKLWPTPTVQDGRGRTHHNQMDGTVHLSLPVVVMREDGKTPKAGGQLNPTWVEWLMGFRLEWTALDAWAMQWFQSKRARRSKSCQESEV